MLGHVVVLFLVSDQLRVNTTEKVTIQELCHPALIFVDTFLMTFLVT